MKRPTVTTSASISVLIALVLAWLLPLQAHTQTSTSTSTSTRVTSNAPSHMEAGTTWYMNGVDSLGLSYEKQVKDGGALTEHKHYLVAGGESFALHTLREGVIGNKPASQVSYLHHDHLGSLAAVSSESGAVIERLAYDPWGKRRNVDGLADPNDTLTASTTKRGYTMHEHMDEMGVINMNGRVYDPLIGRFLTADPHIQAPDDLQSFNRYSYVKNNPLAYTDPSGYFFKKLKKIFKKAIAVVAIVVAVVVAVYVMPAVLAAMPSVGAALGTVGAKVLTGAVAGGLSSAVAAGSGKAFWKGAVSGAVFAGAGLAGQGANAYSPQHFAAHAGAGCVSAVASGGNCGRGMASALVGKYVTGVSAGIGGDGIAGDIARGAMASVGGGLAAVAGGGKFEDGAITAAYGYLFNQFQNQLDKSKPIACAGGKCQQTVYDEQYRYTGKIRVEWADPNWDDPRNYSFDLKDVIKSTRSGLNAELHGT